MQKKFRLRSAASLASVFALMASPVFAQTAGGQTAEIPASGEASGGSPIVVTGLRLQVAGDLQPVTSPVLSLTRQDITVSGTQRAEDLLNTLPQVFASQTATVGVAASGTAGVDLRGFGPERTLVLINGRRLSPGDPRSSDADLNFIPTALVRRIDVLTGGASATYGADAVAGVVNFVMDADFTGFRVDANLGAYHHDNRNRIVPDFLDASGGAQSGYGYPRGGTLDGEQFDATLAFGTRFADGRGHVTAYAGYRKASPILQGARDFSACALLDMGEGTQCGGSFTTAPAAAAFFVDGMGQPVIATVGEGTLAPGIAGLYNYAPFNNLQRADRRLTAGAFADFEVSDGFHPYLEAMVMDDRTSIQGAPAGDFGDTVTINCDNPLMSPIQQAFICAPANQIAVIVDGMPFPSGVANAPPMDFTDPTTGATYNKAFLQLFRRNVEGVPRVTDIRHTAWRTVLGAKGELGKGWAYDAYYQYGRTEYAQVNRNEFSVTRLTNALDVVTDPDSGQSVCRVTLAGSDPACVPYDVFGTAPSAAAIGYISASGRFDGAVTQQVGSVNFTGKLGEYGVISPWAKRGVEVSLGGELRREAMHFEPGGAFLNDRLAGQVAPTFPVRGSYHVAELIGEAAVPLIEGGIVHSLALNGGYRYSHYGIAGGKTFDSHTFRLGFDLAPVPGLRLRGGVNRAVRAPSIQQLFAPQFARLEMVADPCAGRVLTAADTGCLAQGLSVGQFVMPNPASQYNSLQGGNPDLKPERSTTRTLGVVVQPGGASNLTLSADWFDIRITGAIQQFGVAAILNACTGGSDPTACALIRRDSAGSLWLSGDGYVMNALTNMGGLRTRGLEWSGNWTGDLGRMGSLAISFSATRLDKYETDNRSAGRYDCVGYFGATCRGVVPRWRHKLRATVQTAGGVGISGQWRYLGPVEVETRSTNPALHGAPNDFDGRIGAQSYFDLSLQVPLMGKAVWRAGINNLFDRQPPLVSNGSACSTGICNGNTYPGTYDALGRYIHTGITVDF